MTTSRAPASTGPRQWIAKKLTEAPFLRGRGLRTEDLKEIDPYVLSALEQNKRNGLVLAVRARWVSLAIVAVLLPIFNPRFEVLFYEFTLLLFALNGWAQLQVGRVTQSGRELFLILLDLAMMTYVLIGPNPLSTEENFPTVFNYRQSEFAFFFILLAGATIAYSWRTLFAVALWTTIMTMSALTLAVSFGLYMPELTRVIEVGFADQDPRLIYFLDPNNAMIDVRIQEVIIFIIVAGILALNGRRTTALILQQAQLARERANLARYFAPTMVDEMAGQDQPLATVRSQNVAVLFADIVGFTRLAEQQTAQQTVQFLRAFHGRLEEAVFDHGGTLDKYLGDGLMATFGTPRVHDTDALHALKCGIAMLQSIEAWNEERKKACEEPIRVSIGIHYGNVVLGDIGSARRLEYAVLGDTVNVASRLEAMTRPLGVNLIVSDAIVQSALDHGYSQDLVLSQIKRIDEPQAVRGRNEPLHVWVA